jgi:hypothetical protein
MKIDKMKCPECGKHGYHPYFMYVLPPVVVFCSLLWLLLSQACTHIQYHENVVKVEDSHICINICDVYGSTAIDTTIPNKCHCTDGLTVDYTTTKKSDSKWTGTVYTFDKPKN